MGWIDLRTSTSSNDDDEALADEPVNVSVTLAALESYHGLATGPEGDGESLYAKNGMSAERIRKAVQSPKCNCGCTMPYRILIKVCLAFWSLQKSAQDAILWSMQTAGADRRKRYYQIEGWYVLGHPLVIISIHVSYSAHPVLFVLVVFPAKIQPWQDMMYVVKLGWGFWALAKTDSDERNAGAGARMRDHWSVDSWDFSWMLSTYNIVSYHKF